MEVTPEIHARFSDATAHWYPTKQKGDNDRVAAAARPMAVGKAPREATQAQENAQAAGEERSANHPPKKFITSLMSIAQVQCSLTLLASNFPQPTWESEASGHQLEPDYFSAPVFGSTGFPPRAPGP